MPNAGNSGHPGAPMGMAPIAHVLWTRHLRFDAADPFWVSRDRFVLSNGHACALLYSMLHLTGYAQFPLAQIQRFRTVGAITPGHPENFMHDHGRVGGVEVTTGPLGQGISNAVGLALAEAHLAAVHNSGEFRVVDAYTYVTVGDGCLQEGVASEAASLAGHLGLHKLIVFYDDNKITIDGSTDISFTEDVTKRFEAYGWQVLQVDDGDHDLAAIDAAIRLAKANKTQPKLIRVKTVIGFDAKKQGTHSVHGSPLGWDETDRLREKYGLPKERHSVPDDVAQLYKAAAARGAQHAAAWRALNARYNNAAFNARLAGQLPDGWQAALPVYKASDKAAATRALGGAALAKVINLVPALIGGSADLTGSNLTRCDTDVDYQKATPHGRYIRFGVREHGMAAICNGIAAFHPGALIPHCATFLNFLQYCLPSVRLSALSHFGVIYVMTHDSIGLGEDGPTHQPINAAAIVRSTPNALFVRPADGNESAAAWAIGLRERTRPTVMAMSRQNTPHLDGSSIEKAFHGAYVVVAGADKPPVVLVGTGTEVALCVDAAKQIAGARVVSMPCCELFDEQPLDYRRSVFPAGVPIVSVEALSTFGWSRYSHAQVGMTTFGCSGPAPEVYKHFGITVDGVVAKANKAIAYYAARPVPDLLERL
jgi:transketolase